MDIKSINYHQQVLTASPSIFAGLEDFLVEGALEIKNILVLLYLFVHTFQNIILQLAIDMLSQNVPQFSCRV